MAFEWLRLHHDMPNDPKFRTIARASGQPIAVVLGVYVHLLINASSSVERGTLDGYNLEDLATALDINASEVGAVIDAMQGRVLEGDKLTGWEKRQTNREDSSTERVRRFRETQRNAMKRDVTHCNAEETHETVSKRNVTADKTRQEEIRTKQEQATTSTIAPLGAVKVHPDLEIYNAYPRKEGKGAAMTEINRAVAGLVKGEAPHAAMTKLEAQRYLMRRVLEYARSPVGNQPDKTKIPHPATWFHQKRYDDDQANWHQMEASNVRNQSKTAGNLNAATGALAILEQAERNSRLADEMQPETGITDEPGNLSHLRTGSIELRS